MKSGDIVRYTKPQDEAERNARFVVIEAHLNQPLARVRIRLLNSGMRMIQPEEVIPAMEVELCAS